MPYLLDANVFIQAKRPSLWNGLLSGVLGLADRELRSPTLALGSASSALRRTRCYELSELVSFLARRRSRDSSDLHP
jgi:hypothetical protein